MAVSGDDVTPPPLLLGPGSGPDTPPDDSDWYRQAVEASPNPIFMVDLGGVVRTWNLACTRAFGYGPELIGHPYRPLAVPADLERLETLRARVLAGESVTGLELRFCARDGSVRQLSSRLYPLFGAGGNVEGCVFANTDVTEHRHLEAQLREQRAFYERILNRVPLEIVVFSPEHRYRFLNPAAIQDDAVREWVLGRDDFEYCEHRGFDRALAETRRARFEWAVEQRGPVELEERFVTPEGAVRHHWRNLSPVYGPDGELQMVLGYGHDVTELKEAQLELQRAHDELEARVRERTRELSEATARLARANEQLQHDAFHDALTGLPNRALFKDRLGRAIERTNRRPDAGYAVLFLDFDRFKVVNDSLGHAAGDALLVALGERLKGCLRPSDTVARLGGDEFTVLLEDVDPEAAAKTAERILEVLRQPFVLGGKPLPVTSSIGVVASGAGYRHPDEVLRDADVAMYRAKALGRGRVQRFTPDLRERAVSRLTFETDLRAATGRGELEVYYQPIVAVGTGEPTGFEALVRWRHPVMGLVGPHEFIPVAEELGVVSEIDRWVLREACAQVKRWQGAFPTRPPLTLNVNLSGQGFARPGLADEIAEVLRETGFDGRGLRLELTESVLVEGSGAVAATLARLRALGVQLHLDDFGTGYSSLAYLHTFPLTVLKLDRSFVGRLGKNPESAEFVGSIVALARSLNLQVTAEGVETPEQLERLRALGCEFGQGFLFARPLDAEAAGRFLTDASLSGSARSVLGA